MKKNGAGFNRGIIKILSLLIVFSSLLLSCSTHQERKDLKEAYNRLIGPLIEYLEGKYVDKMIVKDNITINKDGVVTFYASPEDNDEIEFRIDDCGQMGFSDEYLKCYAEWEAKTIISPIIKKYCNDFYCYTILTIRFADIDVLEDYYMENKKHLNWQEHFGKLNFAGIRIYGFDENRVEQNIVDPLLSDLLKLDFIIERVTFYLYKNERDKETAITYYYEYKDEEYQLREKE